MVREIYDSWDRVNLHDRLHQFVLRIMFELNPYNPACCFVISTTFQTSSIFLFLVNPIHQRITKTFPCDKCCICNVDTIVSHRLIQL